MTRAERLKLEKKKPRFYDEIDAPKVIAAFMQQHRKWKMFFSAHCWVGFAAVAAVGDVDYESDTKTRFGKKRPESG